jgi:hypothetical protein
VALQCVARRLHVPDGVVTGKLVGFGLIIHDKRDFRHEPAHLLLEAHKEPFGVNVDRLDHECETIVFRLQKSRFVLLLQFFFLGVRKEQRRQVGDAPKIQRGSQVSLWNESARHHDRGELDVTLDVAMSSVDEEDDGSDAR